jgi:predicted DNA-binding protein YlxM (UPF0122 family)
MSISENIKKSKRNYGDQYNKINVNVQLNRDLINQLKQKLNKETSIKSFIENLIKNSF